MMRLRLRNKILLPFAGLLLLVVLASLAIINHVVRRQVFAGMSQDLVRARQVFDELHQRKLELLIARSRVMAEAPYLKAAVETEDPSTVQGVAADIFAAVPSDFLIITDEYGRVLAQPGAEPTVGPFFTLDSMQQRGTFAETEIGLYRQGTALFQMVVMPIISGARASGMSVLGAVAFGSRIDAAFLQGFRDLTNSEIVFVFEDEILAATLAQSTLRADTLVKLRQANAKINTVEIDDETFLIAFAADAQLPSRNFVLLRSISAVFEQFLAPIETAILLVALAAIIATIGFSYLIARGLVGPVQRLVTATDAVSAGDYEYPIAVGSRDEIGHLAEKFDEMRQSLKRQMAQLAVRNRDLEAALRRLEQTQTELVQTEKLAATGRITAQLSHELNNPIHNIRSCLETARKRLPTDHAIHEFLDLAHEEVLRIGKLVRQMLDFYRPQSQPRAPCHVDQIISEVVRASGDLLQQSRIRTNLAVGMDLPMVCAARDQLKQVFINLLVNAIDAMPQGGELRITASVRDGFLMLRFSDTGVGILPENVGRIFDAFFTTKSQASGVGLGLSVSYGIVASHGGRIAVESTPSKGSTFTVHLPIMTQSASSS